MSHKDERIDASAFANLVPINVLSPSHREELLQRSEIVSLEQGQQFKGESDAKQSTYYLVEGELGLYVGDRVLHQLEAGTEDARFALTRLNAAPVTARALSRVKLLAVDISLVSTLLIWVQSAASETAVEWVRKDQDSWIPKLLGSELFARIPAANIPKLFSHLEPVAAKAEETIVRQDDAGDYYYIVRRGNCAVTRESESGSTPVLLASLGPGDSFGEEALVAQAKRNATVTMVSDGELLRLTKADFQALVIEPVLSTIGSAEARQMAALGARWLDVRLPEEHGRDGIPSSINLALNHLREGASELSADTDYIVYSDSARRSKAGAFLLTELGFSAYVLEGGLVGSPGLSGPPQPTAVAETVPTPTREPPLIDGEMISRELARATEDVESALQDKLDATSARRLYASEIAAEMDKVARQKIEARQKRLKLESSTATAALQQAQRRKLEIESKLRAAETEAERRRAEAEIECENLRRTAETRLKEEERRLQEQYAIAAGKLDQLKRTRAETEERLRKERERIEAELAETEKTLQSEAEKIKAELRRVKAETEHKAGQIRTDGASQEKRVRAETESILKEERQKLESEFMQSLSGLEKAQGKLDEASKAKSQIDAEAERIVASMRAADAKRRAEAEARRKAEQDRTEAQALQARQQLEKAKQMKTSAETKRREAMQNLARIRAASGDDDSEDAESLQAEIERIDANVTDALGKVDAAQRAKDDAEAVRIATEEKVAHQRATEAELRTQLQTEADEWLDKERARCAAELERAKTDLADKWALKEEAERRRKNSTEEQDSSLFGDITAQLSVEDEAIKTAIEEADRNRDAPPESNEATNERLNRLKRQGLLD